MFSLCGKRYFSRVSFYISELAGLDSDLKDCFTSERCLQIFNISIVDKLIHTTYDVCFDNIIDYGEYL